MTLDAISSTGSMTPMPAAGSSQSMLGGLDSDGFLKLLIAQLRYQSPLAPSDPTDLMLQTSALAQLDAVQQIVALQRRDLGLQESVAAASLIGLTVSGISSSGHQLEGTVDAVRYTAAGPVLKIGTDELALGEVVELRRP